MGSGASTSAGLSTAKHTVKRELKYATEITTDGRDEKEVTTYENEVVGMNDELKSLSNNYHSIIIMHYTDYRAWDSHWKLRCIKERGTCSWLIAKINVSCI